MRTFQQVVSLGPNCRAKHNIQRYFGKHVSRRGVFDWQRADHTAVVEYLARDFIGMFERSDLVVVDGAVYNRRFGVQHPHEFPKPMTEDLLEALYPSARDKHDKWCATSRQALDNGLSTLFVLAEPLQPDVFIEIRDFLEQRCSKPFHLLPAPEGDDDMRLHWEGSPELWDKHLSPFAIDQTLSVRASNLIFRIRKNLRYLAPMRSMRA